MKLKYMSKEKSNLRIVGLSSYERPEVKEYSGKDYVEYGTNNDYFNDLVDRFLGSPTNARCINGISDMIYGRGLDAVDRNINRDSYIEMKNL